MVSSTAQPVCVASVADSVNYIYVTFIELIMAIGYVWVMWRVGRSKIPELKGSFYSFFILTGIPACLNLLTVIFRPRSDNDAQGLSWKEIIYKCIFFASMWFSLSHTVGRVLGVAAVYCSMFSTRCNRCETSAYTTKTDVECLKTPSETRPYDCRR
ncbi:hypothetical protein PMAYCL1PPCAC_00710, partial [Pristionchus mayeri]